MNLFPTSKVGTSGDIVLKYIYIYIYIYWHNIYILGIYLDPPVE